MDKYYLTMDIGATKTSSALFNQEGTLLDNFVALAKSKTYEGQEAVYQNTKSVLDVVIEHFSLNMDKVQAIGVGSPGPLDSKKGIIIHAPLMGWRNFPIVEKLEKNYKKQVFLDNDGNLGALAEVRCGVAKGLSNILYMTVSTGCGGGIIINNQVYHGVTDGAGEVGHMTIDPNGLDCPCGSKGCFELYASGTAMNLKMQHDMEAGEKSRVFELAEYDKTKINGYLLDIAASEGEKYALDLFKKEGYYLGVSIANQFNMMNPECIVLGGGVTKSKRFFHDELIKTLKKYCIQEVKEDSVRYSTLNDRVVLYGAFFNVKEKMLRD
ncbi:MAG: ROK family protein [Bacilli bacterium]